MIPVRDDQPRFSTPNVTYFLIGLNSVIFLFESALTPDSFKTLLYQFGMIPANITGYLYGDGRLGLIAVLLPALTSMFLHASWAHLLGNMLYLSVFGPPIEARTGAGRFFVFYMACGLIAGVAHVLAGPDSVVPVVGASGAVSGILGAYVLTFPLTEVPIIIRLMTFGWFTPRLPAAVVFGFWLLLQWVGHLTAQPGEVGGVAFMAHIGGFVAGLVLAAFMVPNRPPPGPPKRHGWTSY